MNKVQNVYYKKNTVKNSLYIFDFVILNLIYYFSLIYLTRKMEYHEVMTMLMVVTITFLSFRLYNMYQELEHIRYRELVVKSFIANADYHGAVDKWLAKHSKKTVFCFVQFKDLQLHEMPRLYLATPTEIADWLKRSAAGRGDTMG